MRLTKLSRFAFVNAVIADTPQIDYVEKIREKVNALIKQTYLSQRMEHLNQERLHERYLNVHGVGCYTKGLLEEEREEICNNSEICELADKKSIQDEEINKVIVKLQGAIDGCTSVKQAVALMPEFEKYLPTETGPSSRSLPAIANVVASLVELGWPKDKEK